MRARPSPTVSDVPIGDGISAVRRRLSYPRPPTDDRYDKSRTNRVSDQLDPVFKTSCDQHLRGGPLVSEGGLELPHTGC